MVISARSRLLRPVCAQERAFELEEARDILLAEEVRLQRGRRGGGEAIAHLDLELQVGQRRGVVSSKSTISRNQSRSRAMLTAKGSMSTP